jgi:hypothetical protein
LFKPQGTSVNKKSNGVKRQYRAIDPMRRREAGTRAYIKNNPQNKDGV